MNIPDEVLTEAFGGIHFYEPYYSIHLKQAQVIAEWARKEALREAAESVRDYWATFGDLISSNNGARLAFEAVAARIAEGVRS